MSYSTCPEICATRMSSKLSICKILFVLSLPCLTNHNRTLSSHMMMTHSPSLMTLTMTKMKWLKTLHQHWHIMIGCQQWCQSSNTYHACHQHMKALTWHTEQLSWFCEGGRLVSTLWTCEEPLPINCFNTHMSCVWHLARWSAIMPDHQSKNSMMSYLFTAVHILNATWQWSGLLPANISYPVFPCCQNKMSRQARHSWLLTSPGHPLFVFPGYGRLIYRQQKTPHQPCKNVHARFAIYNYLIPLSVWRVHWLRAQAQKECWEEEVILIWYEMQWTVQYFLHNRGLWEEHHRNSIGPGLVAYCHMQGFNVEFYGPSCWPYILWAE